MKLMLLGTMAIASLAWGQPALTADTRGPSFCMQNFNAYGPLYAPETEERMNWIGSLLQEAPRCSVIHLQEVWSESNIDQIESSLSRKYSISSPNRESRIGVMSLFDGEITGTYTQNFNVNNEGGILDGIREALNVKKAFHIVRTQLFDMGEQFYFINTHLHPTSQAVRLTQIIDILEWRLYNQDLKFFLSGDFNADENSLERDFIMTALGSHDSLQDAYGGEYPAGLCTYCNSNPHSWLLESKILDYIFVSNIGGNETHLKSREGEVNMRGPLAEPLSDHYGIRVYFELQQGREANSAEQLAARQKALLSTLTKVYRILSQEEEPAFAPYAARVKELKRQILQGSGEFDQYTKKFN
jgi:endonuclease/exonuclease/phosphatase family metal-dependent hydrolase